MARDHYADTIGAFVADLEPNIIGPRRLRRRVAEEMYGHLEEATEHHQARGLSLREAPRKAIEDSARPRSYWPAGRNRKESECRQHSRGTRAWPASSGQPD